VDTLIGLLGLILGAAINGLADSLPRSRGLQRPHCRACGAPRPPRAWSSLLGLATGARRCAYCGISQAWRAPILEILAVAGSLWLYHRDPTAGVFWKGLLVSAVLLLIVVTDLEHRLIPHVVTGPAAIAFALLGAFDPSRGPLKTLAGGLVGLGLFYVLYLLGGVFARLVARRRGHPLDEVAFGFGDVTLAGVIGLAVGWPGVLVALVLGILAAGAYSLAYLLVLLIRRRYTAFIPIPYGPFMVLGALIVYFRLWTAVGAGLAGG